MIDPPYTPRDEVELRDIRPSKPQLAGFLDRFVAYVIDIIPVTLAVWAVFYYGLGFDEIWDLRFSTDRSHPDFTEIQAKFLEDRNVVRDSAMVAYIAYCAIMEASSWSATLGKRIVGIRTTDMEGDPLAGNQALKRNVFKALSAMVFALGFLWVLVSKRNQGWHDSIAKTLVVKGRT